MLFVWDGSGVLTMFVIGDEGLTGVFSGESKRKGEDAGFHCTLSSEALKGLSDTEISAALRAAFKVVHESIPKAEIAHILSKPYEGGGDSSRCFNGGE